MKVLYFTSPTCAPCKSLKPVAQEVSLKTGIPIEYIDISQNMEAIKSFNITGVPTLIGINSGQIRFRHTGVLSKQSLEHYFKLVSI